MDDRITITKAELAQIMGIPTEEPPNGILEHLWQTYDAYNPLDDAQVRKAEKEVKALHEGLTWEEPNQVYFIISQLCYAYERTGFLAGIRVGVKLAKELTR